MIALKNTGSASGRSSVARNTLIVLAFSLLGKLLSLVRESSIAAYAGTSMGADAYYMVLSVFAALELGLSTSIFQSFFPIYRQMTLKAEDGERAKRFTNTAFTLLMLCAAGLAVLELLGRDLLVGIAAPGYGAEAKGIAASLVLYAAPMQVFIVAAECISAMLRAHDRFVSSQSREVATHVGAIAVILLLYRHIGVQALGVSMLLGAVARLAVQLPAMGRIHRLRPVFDFRNSDVREMLRRIPAILISASSTQLKAIVDKIMASLLPSGTVSVLNYGHRLESALGGLLSTALATGMYPEMVALYVRGEKEKLSRLLYRSIQLFALIVIPVCVGGFFVGQPIVSIVYQRGAFGAGEVQATASVFAAYLLGTFFQGASNIVSNVFFSAGNTKTPMIINCVDLVLNAALNLLLMQLMGVVGLALATSISTIIVCVVRFAMVRRYLILPDRAFWAELLRFAAGALLAGVISSALIRWMGTEAQLLILIGTVAIFIPIYAVFLFLTRSQSAAEALALLRKKLGGGRK